MSCRALATLLLSMVTVTVSAGLAQTALPGRSISTTGLPEGEAGFVVAVPAGELLEVSLPGGTRRVRLLGASAPRIGPTLRHREFFAEQSRDFVSRLALRKRVVIVAEADAEPTPPGSPVPGFVYLPGGRLLNEEVVRTGHGFAEPGCSRSSRLAAAEAEARAAGRGLWAERSIPELEWNLAEGRRPFVVHRMTDGSWGLQLGRLVRTHVAPEELVAALAELRAASEDDEGGALEARLRAAGWAEVDSGRDVWRRALPAAAIDAGS